MKSEKGMSHIATIICAIILIVIVIVGIKIFLNKNDDRIVTNFKTDMLILQGKIKVISQENEMNGEEHPLIGKKLADNLEDEKVKELLEKGIINQDEEYFDNYYIIDSQTLLSELNLWDSLKGEYYIVNYESYAVIYSKGVEVKGVVKYSLKELLEDDVQEEQENTEVEENVEQEASSSEEQ